MADDRFFAYRELLLRFLDECEHAKRQPKPPSAKASVSITKPIFVNACRNPSPHSSDDSLTETCTVSSSYHDQIVSKYRNLRPFRRRFRSVCSSRIDSR